MCKRGVGWLHFGFVFGQGGVADGFTVENVVLGWVSGGFRFGSGWGTDSLRWF